MADRSLRVAGIRFANAIPLIFGLQNSENVQLSLDTPSNCFHKLAANEVDVALIPAIGAQIDPRIRFLKGLGIAAATKTESVYLFAKTPLDHVQSVLTDPSSLTSVILLKIIFREKYRHLPTFETGSIQNVHEVLRSYDAALIIGDEAILTEKTDYDHYDLATEWHSLTGLPFVFALWASNRQLTEDEKVLIRSSYQIATQHWDDILALASDILPVEHAFLKRYYKENLHFQLSRTDYEGLLKFLTFAAELHFIDKVRKDIWL